MAIKDQVGIGDQLFGIINIHTPGIFKFQQNILNIATLSRCISQGEGALGLFLVGVCLGHVKTLTLSQTNLFDVVYTIPDSGL